MPRLILMCGLPGSGKTTLGRRLADEVPAIRLCTDEWQAALGVDLEEGDRDSEAFHDLLEDQLWRHAQDLIRHGQSVIFEKGLWLRSEREEKRREAQELGVDIELHYFDVPLDELARRLDKRNAAGHPGDFAITRQQLGACFQIFEPPDEAELALFPVAVVHRAHPVIPAVVRRGPVRDNDAMAADYDGTAAFRGASFNGADFTGAHFRDCELSQVKITDSWLTNVSLSGLVENLVVNDVDVTAFVEGELDKRHPERVQLRAMRTADDYRAMWSTIEQLWAGTVDRARRLPEPVLEQRVDGEWSFVETLRHLVMATDRWATYMILDRPAPYHRLGLTQPTFPPAEAAALGIDLDARPSLAEVLEARASRLALVRGIVDGLTDDDLERVCPRLPSHEYPEQDRSVGLCLGVVMREECEHRRYAVRDLAVLEAQSRGGQRQKG